MLVSREGCILPGQDEEFGGSETRVAGRSKVKWTIVQ